MIGPVEGEIWGSDKKDNRTKNGPGPKFDDVPGILDLPQRGLQSIDVRQKDIHIFREKKLNKW